MRRKKKEENGKKGSGQKKGQVLERRRSTYALQWKDGRRNEDDKWGVGEGMSWKEDMKNTQYVLKNGGKKRGGEAGDNSSDSFECHQKYLF